jgi:glycosyltransferase involved in cell wall biosynthesis
LRAVASRVSVAAILAGCAGVDSIDSYRRSLSGVKMEELAFFGALALIVWVYIGYPMVLYVAVRLRRKPVRRARIEPRVSMIITAYNEESDIRRKLQDTLALDYPADRLEIIVASDGSTDATDSIVQEFHPHVRLVRVEGRLGKTIAQNAAVAVATGEILVFSDVTSVYAPRTIRAMVRNFADPTVGCVSGRVVYEKDPSNAMAFGRATFWDYERRLRMWETAVHSIIGASGCGYAIRASLYVHLDGAASSDFVQAGQVTARGYRTVEDPQAVAYEPVESASLSSEVQRRARVAAGGLYGAFLLREMLNPFRHPWFALELWSHRVLRWLAPVFLLVLFGASIALADDGPIYQLVLFAQLAFYAVGATQFLLYRFTLRASGIYLIPLYVCLVNVAALIALARLARGNRVVAWDTAR